MSKYSTEKKPPMISKLVKFEQEQIDGVGSFHDNFSEFVRDALEEKLIREEALRDERDNVSSPVLREDQLALNIV